MTSETNLDTNPIGTCLMPVFLDERMIVCDSYKKWYHCSCMLADGNVSDCSVADPGGFLWLQWKPPFWTVPCARKPYGVVSKPSPAKSGLLERVLRSCRGLRRRGSRGYIGTAERINRFGFRLLFASRLTACSSYPYLT